MGITRLAFVDDMQAAKDFATGDVVRRMGYRELLPGPFFGQVIYSNPRTGMVFVQWPWGAEGHSATDLIRDVSGFFSPNTALNQLYPTWESARHVNGEADVKGDEKWRKALVKGDDKWRKALASVDQSASSPDRLARIVLKYEEHTLPVWRAACKAWHDGLDEIAAFRRVAGAHVRHFGLDAVRITVSNLYGLAASPDPRLALYWKDGNRRYKVTKRERASGTFTCPRCKGPLKPRVYRHRRKCLQCRGCGFMISHKDLIVDGSSVEDQPGAEEQPRQAAGNLTLKDIIGDPSGLSSLDAREKATLAKQPEFQAFLRSELGLLPYDEIPYDGARLTLINLGLDESDAGNWALWAAGSF